MKYFVIAICLMFSSLAFAELPPPGKARTGKITVDPYNQGKVSEYDLETQKVINRADSRRVQKKLDALRKQIADLQRENNRLREESRALASRSPQAQPARVIAQAETVKPSKKNRVTLLAGYGPSHLSDERLGSDTGNEVALKQGPLVGIGYSRLITESVSLGAQVVIPTYEDRSGDWIKKKQERVSGMAVLGFDF